MSNELIAEATDLQRRLPFWKRQAQRQPVIVKNHGQEEVIILSPEEYHYLMRRHRRVIGPGEFTEEELKAISKSRVPPEYDYLNEELKDWKP